MILTALVAVSYPLAVQYKRGGLWTLLAPFTAVVLLVDFLASFTEWSLVFGAPKRGEYTITQRIESMHTDKLESRRNLAKLVQIYLDACEPDGKH